MNNKIYSIWECNIHGRFKTIQAKARCPKCKSVKVHYIGKLEELKTSLKQDKPEVEDEN